MEQGGEDAAFWGRLDVRAAIAAGYALLAVLIIYPPASSGDAALQTAPDAKSAASAVAPAVPVPADGLATAPVASTPDPAAEAAIAALAQITNYEQAKWHPLHFRPAIETATNAQCLACHKEVLEHKVRNKSPAGVEAAKTVAWYQTLDTYQGAQEDFHVRHMTSPLAAKVMNLKCNFCHQGNDPREEAPHSHATAARGTFALRKTVDPVNTCLRCHGNFPGQVMGFDDATWPSLRESMETPELPNGCLSCHAEQFRTVRHQVNYLNAQAIEEEAKTSADLCFGCHGGRAWYRTSYPYPRHPWPGMDTAIPDWARNRALQSDAEHRIEKVAK
jgi:hypothetical protein